MFIWRGYGAAVFGAAFASALAVNLIANITGGPGYWDKHGWPIAISLFMAAIVLWRLDIALAEQPARTLVDEATGERVTIAKQHDFFFLRIRWWALIFVGLGVLVLVTGWVPGSR